MEILKGPENIFNRASVKEHEKVAIIAKNSLEYAAAINLCWKMNLTAVPLNINFPQKKIDSILSGIDCRHVILGDDLDLRFKKDTKIFFISEQIKAQKELRLRLSNKKLSQCLDHDSNIIFTSGSSSSPKAVLHSISNHYYSALGANRNMPLGQDSVYLVALPFYHISGFSIIMRALLSGASIAVKIPGFSIAETAKKVNATHISLVASQLFEMMHDQKSIKVLKSMEAILLGGSRVSDSLVEECFYHRLNIYRTYGLTEMSSQVCATANKDSLDHLKTSGRTLKYRQFTIGKNNEVLVRGKTLFKGYLKNNKIEIIPKSGWFHTKDTGFIDEEGYLNITGRMDSMFTFKGTKIYPEEVEKQINAFEYIIDSLVINIEERENENSIIAFIKTSGALDKNELLKFLKKRLEKQKIPKYFLDWPKEKNLKPDRDRFKEIAIKRLSKNKNNLSMS